MPFTWENNKVAVEPSELIPQFWNTLGALQKQLRRDENKTYGIKRLQLGGKGRRLLIDFDTLSKTQQEKLGDPRKVNHPLESFFKFDADAVRYYAKFKRENGSYLSAEEQERYIINASVLKAVVALEEARTQERIKMRGSLSGLTETLRLDAISFQNSLKVLHNVEHTLPTSPRFKEALKNFKKSDENGGYYSLIKDPKGTKALNALKVDSNVEMLLNALFKNQLHKPTPTEVARNYEAFINGYAEVYNEDTGELYDPKGFPSLSQSTVISWINKWENKIATHKARSGDRQKFIGAFKPHHQMDLPTFAGSLLSIDDRQPPFWYDNNRNRAWFYIGIDVASQCITSVVHGKTKEGIILDFYRQIIRNYTEWGLCLPSELECESSLNSSFKETILRPGAMFDNVRIEANNARGKYIERMFGKVRYGLEKENLGWIARPGANSEANQSSSTETKIIPYDQLINDRMLDLEKWNNMPHPTEPTMSRFDYFLAKQHPELKPTNWEAILPHIGFKTETSCQVGYVSLQGKKRAIAENGGILTGEALIQKMKIIEGKELDVYWLDGNDGNVLKALVYLKGTTKLVCEVMELPRYNRATLERSTEDDAARQLQSSYVASVEAFCRQQSNRIENIQIKDNTPKTVNSNFQFSTIKRYTAPDEPAQVFSNDIEDENELVPVPVANSWRNQYLQ
ncbi:hypothetical protein [Flavobacterium sp. N1994]|uniref:hypothetical protein n=1 Tax=Flavobacterium sp. N1994 TaxID=2986827 RepID=UPI002223B2C9|nr:hypothetical protein [Flavobacterium sp. N1994]